MPVAFSIPHSRILANEYLYPICPFSARYISALLSFVSKKNESSNKFMNCKRVCKESTLESGIHVSSLNLGISKLFVRDGILQVS